MSFLYFQARIIAPFWTGFFIKNILSHQSLLALEKPPNERAIDGQIPPLVIYDKFFIP